MPPWGGAAEIGSCRRCCLGWARSKEPTLRLFQLCKSQQDQQMLLDPLSDDSLLGLAFPTTALYWVCPVVLPTRTPRPLLLSRWQLRPHGCLCAAGRSHVTLGPPEWLFQFGCSSAHPPQSGETLWEFFTICFGPHHQSLGAPAKLALWLITLNSRARDLLKV